MIEKLGTYIVQRLVSEEAPNRFEQAQTGLNTDQLIYVYVSSRSTELWGLLVFLGTYNKQPAKRPVTSRSTYQVAEDGHEEHDLWDELQDDVGHALLDEVVPEAERESKDHVEQPKDQRDLHLVRVQERNLVLRRLPHGINAWNNKKNVESKIKQSLFSLVR